MFILSGGTCYRDKTATLQSLLVTLLPKSSPFSTWKDPFLRPRFWHYKVTLWSKPNQYSLILEIIQCSGNYWCPRSIPISEDVHLICANLLSRTWESSSPGTCQQWLITTLSLAYAFQPAATHLTTGSYPPPSNTSSIKFRSNFIFFKLGDSPVLYLARFFCLVHIKVIAYYQTDWCVRVWERKGLWCDMWGLGGFATARKCCEVSHGRLETMWMGMRCCH